MKHARHTLEARALDLLRPLSLHDSTLYTLRAHELWRDCDGGWSSNDRFTLARDVDLAEALRAIRRRWEVFRANYAPRARISDVDTLDAWHDYRDAAHLSLEAAGLAFVDIEASGPLVDLLDLIGDAYDIDPAAIAQDLHKARRECTLEEYPADLHQARLAALATLTNPTA